MPQPPWDPPPHLRAPGARSPGGNRTLRELSDGLDSKPCASSTRDIGSARFARDARSTRRATASLRSCDSTGLVQDERARRGRVVSRSSATTCSATSWRRRHRRRAARMRSGRARRFHGLRAAFRTAGTPGARSAALQHNLHQFLSRAAATIRPRCCCSEHAGRGTARTFLLDLSASYRERGYSSTEFVLRVTRRRSAATSASSSKPAAGRSRAFRKRDCSRCRAGQ